MERIKVMIKEDAASRINILHVDDVITEREHLIAGKVYEVLQTREEVTITVVTDLRGDKPKITSNEVRKIRHFTLETEHDGEQEFPARDFHIV